MSILVSKYQNQRFYLNVQSQILFSKLLNYKSFHFFLLVSVFHIFFLMQKYFILPCQIYTCTVRKLGNKKQSLWSEKIIPMLENSKVEWCSTIFYIILHTYYNDVSIYVIFYIYFTDVC